MCRANGLEVRWGGDGCPDLPEAAQDEPGCVVNPGSDNVSNGMQETQCDHESRTVGKRVVILDLVDSTNAEALRRAGAGERGPLWIVATEQSAGRGRRGRAWMSPAGNLHATLLLIDPSPPAAAPQLGFVAGLALHDAIAAAAPSLVSQLALKWPNDLLCAGHKIAGILIEGEGEPVAVAVGIGVNCRHHPGATEYPVTDLAAVGADIGALTLFDALAVAMQARLDEWSRGAGFAAIRLAWLARAAGIGEPVRVRLSGRETTGRFETIDDSGRLMLRTGVDDVETIAAGDVFPLEQTRRAG
jgi:BirA family transcriptional regulator, biotin operon repressor / biotin---[acetyl-CoA-carboxylase] ligase